MEDHINDIDKIRPLQSDKEKRLMNDNVRLVIKNSMRDNLDSLKYQ